MMFSEQNITSQTYIDYNRAFLLQPCCDHMIHPVIMGSSIYRLCKFSAQLLANSNTYCMASLGIQQFLLLLGMPLTASDIYLHM